MTGTLSDRDRELLDLSYRHGLDVDELAMVLGVSSGEANTMVRRLQRTVRRFPGPLLVSLAVGSGQHAYREPAGAHAFLTAPGWLRSRTLNAVRKKVCDGGTSHAPTCEGGPSGVAPLRRRFP